MINETRDFAILANLLLPMDFQLPIDISNDFYDRITLSQLELFLRGQITFIKFLESDIQVIDKGTIFENYEHKILIPKSSNIKGEPLLPLKRKLENNEIIDYQIPKEKKQPLVEASYKKYNSQLKIYNLIMKEIQLETYIQTLGDTANFSASQKQASVFVFPNGQYGNEGFKNYVEKDEYGNYQFRKKVTYRNEEKILTSAKPLPVFFNIDNEENINISLQNLENFSCKFKFYIEKELIASRKEKPGNSFCYIEFVESSGAILLGMLLKLFGFEEFKTTVDPFNIRSGKLENLEKKKRFALITGQSKNIETTLKLFNSSENKHGEYIQMIIASKLARDGINIFNVLRGYIMTPGWHEAGMYQALSRFIRADSHVLLSDESSSKIKVEVFRLAAIRPDEEEILYKKGLNKCVIDIKNYLNSEEKNIKNKRIIRFMKQIAFDAYLTYDRNTGTDIKPFSSQSDYADRYYKIWKAAGLPNNDNRKGLAKNQGPNKEEFLYNTYNLFYSDKDIIKVKNKIIDILQINNFITFSDLEKELRKAKIYFSNYIIYQSVYELVYNNETISNYQNTLLYRLYLTGNIIYMKRENLMINNRLSTENDIYFTKSYPLIEKTINISEETEIYEKMVSYLEDKTEEEITNYYINRQNYNLFKRLLEDSLVALKNDNLTQLNKNILKLMNNYYLVTDKPIAYLEAAQEALTTITQGQGRKRGAGSEAGLKKLNLDDVDNKVEKEKEYVHFYKSSEKTAFAITSILESSQRTIRILKDNEFVDTNSSESFVYNYLFTKKYDIIMKRFREVPYYGTYILRGGEEEKFLAKKEKNFFRIVDNSNPRNKGIICLTDNTKHIENIVRYLDKNKKYESIYNNKIKKPELCNTLIKLFRENNLMFESF